MADFDTWRITASVTVQPSNRVINLLEEVDSPEEVLEYIKSLYHIHHVMSVQVVFVKGHYN